MKKNSLKEKIITNLKNTYCRLAPSKISGVGVFSVRDIPKNKNPFLGILNKKWAKFNIKELSQIDKEVLKMVDDFFVIEKDGTIYLPEDGLSGIDVSFFPNHSKKPNLKISWDKETDVLFFKTLRKIKKGEELTADYSTYDYKYE